MALTICFSQGFSFSGLFMTSLQYQQKGQDSSRILIPGIQYGAPSKKRFRAVPDALAVGKNSLKCGVT